MLKNKLLISILMIIIIGFVSISIYATVPSEPGVNPNTVPSGVKNSTIKLWGTVSYVVQIIAIGCVIYAGVRYMFASSSQRADIKKGLIYLVVGSIFVFSAVRIIKLVTSVKLR